MITFMKQEKDQLEVMGSNLNLVFDKALGIIGNMHCFNSMLCYLLLKPDNLSEISD